MTNAVGSELSIEASLRLIFAAVHSAADATRHGEIEVDLVETATRAAASRGFDREKFSNFASSKPSAAMLRGLLFGALTPHDRVRLRRDSGAAALSGSRDEAAGAAAVAVAVITADLARGFELADCTTRCHQTLLEEAPLAVLDALSPLPDGVDITASDSAIASLQAAITAVTRFGAPQSIISALPEGDGVATVLAAAFAALAQRELQPGSLPPAAERAISDLAGVQRG